MSGAKTITFRLPAELRADLESEIEALEPYMPTISAVMERGLVLAIDEMKSRRLAALSKPNAPGAENPNGIAVTVNEDRGPGIAEHRYSNTPADGGA